MARRFALPLLAALCLAPATAQAAVSDFGSDLSSPANLVASHGADTSYWNVGATPPLGSYVAPAEGQVTVVKLRGGVIPNPRLRNSDEERLAQIIHFQVLRDTGDGRLKVVQLSTGHLQIPVTADQNEVTTYNPVNLCVKQGDLVAFNTIGAHEYRRDPGSLGGPQGAEYQVFGRVPGSATQWYEKDNGLNEGTKILPSPNDLMQGYELLMRTTLATGPDATDVCPGGYAQHIFRGADINPPPRVSPIVVRTKDRTARVRIFCHGENYGGCVGTLKLLDGDQQEIGSRRFDVRSTHTEAVEVKLSDAAIGAIQAAGSLRVTAVADATDKPSADPRNTDAPGTRPGPQQKTTTEELTLKPDKAPCIVPKKLVGKSSKVAKGLIRKAGCKAVVKYKKTKKAKESGRVLSHTPPAGTVLPANAAVTITIGRRR
jgi:hypothetical protein